MTIRRLEWIKDCGIFNDYTWDPGLPDLARINVIYGANGAGKTSLSSAFDGLRYPPEQKGYMNVSIALQGSLSARSTDGLDDPSFGRVHVFSERYVARGHKFTPAEAEMDAVLTIGVKPIDIELRLEKLRGEWRTKTDARSTANDAEAAANQAVQTAFGQVSQQVVDAVSRAGGRYRSRSNFHAGMVRTAFAGSHASWMTLTDVKLQQYLGLVNAEQTQVLAGAEVLVNAPADLKNRIVGVIETMPSTIILDTLTRNPGATAWVNEGRHLHDSANANACIFCGSALTAERLSEIDKHFSDEVEKLSRTTDALEKELEAIAAQVDAALASIPSKALFYQDLRARYDLAASSLRMELTALKDWVKQACEHVKVKAANVLSRVEVTLAQAPAVSGLEFEALRVEHDDRAARHGSLVLEAARAVESHYLKRAEADVKTNVDLAKSATSLGESLDKDLANLTAEILGLEAVEGDPIPSSRVLTREVARLLGRSELKFETSDGRYKVTRQGRPAVGLSMGERTAITLVHFLETVARFNVAGGKPIVVIDDPVSSLDSDIFMGVSTYIWNETVVKEHIAQVVLLTHNFELFRQWDIQVEGLHGGSKKRMALYPAQFYEIGSRHVTSSGPTFRRPALTTWPPTAMARKKVRSTYHHAFIAAAEVSRRLSVDDSMENRLDAQLLFPNVIRRMLETFLAFKRPEWVGDFGGAMRKSADLLVEGGYKGDADALRLRLTRYAHAHSHSESPATDQVVSPDEISTAILAVFEFMNHLDPAHFRGLCEVVEISPEVLLRASPEVIGAE